jgi:hypothetical protein
MTPDEKLASIKARYSGRIKIILQQVARDLVDPIIDLIKIRTQIEGEGTKGSLSPLSSSYIKQRERYADNLSSETSPKKSNLTATGQLIDALTGKAGGGKVVVTINKKRRKPDVSGSRSGLTNDQVRKYAEENGREFLKLSEAEKKEVTEIATQLINEKLSKLLK